MTCNHVPYSLLIVRKSVLVFNDYLENNTYMKLVFITKRYDICTFHPLSIYQNAQKVFSDLRAKLQSELSRLNRHYNGYF